MFSVDIDADSSLDYCVVASANPLCFEQADGGWQFLGTLRQQPTSQQSDREALIAVLDEGSVHAVPSRFSDVRIGGILLRLDTAR